MTICGTHVMVSVQDLGKCSDGRGASDIILCLEAFKELEVKQNIVIHCDQATHPFLNQYLPLLSLSFSDVNVGSHIDPIFT